MVIHRAERFLYLNFVLMVYLKFYGLSDESASIVWL